MKVKGNKFCIIAVIIWMALIFSFSARTGSMSQEDSHHAGIVIGEIFVPKFEQWSEEKQIQFAQKIDKVVRKGAHCTEYFILGMLLAGACTVEKKRCPILIGICYAASDEIHQLFVPGRSGQLMDVCIDSAGVILGVLFISGLIRCWKMRKNS